MLTAPADVMETDIGTYNTGSVAETVRKVHYWWRSLACWWGLAVALGGGSGTSPESRCDRTAGTVVGAGYYGGIK